jgi:UDP-GlcNAc3NAcA epimerase
MLMKVISVLGARPQFIKAGPVSRAFQKTPGIQEILIHTGQHFDSNMSQVFFDELEIPKPKYQLDIHGGNHGLMTGRMLEAIENVLLEEKPNAVMVYGDTNSTLAGALAASKLHIPLIHVEAGLRSFNKKMPEEINRILTDHVSSLLACPTKTAIENLRAENITKNVYLTGDVMFDATLFATQKAKQNSTIITDLNLKEGNYCLATIHRAENTDDLLRLKKIITYIQQNAQYPVVLPLHPRTKKVAEAEGIDFGSIHLVDPIGYFDMHRLLLGAVEVYTDSGGLQKEAYFHGKPCVTLRDETEWVETIDAGWNRLWIVSQYKTPRTSIEDYGKGQSSEVLVDIILSYLKK